MVSTTTRTARQNTLTSIAVSENQLAQLALYEQYAAAAYCPNNNIPSSSNVISCSTGNCPLVQAAGATSLTEFQEYFWRKSYQDLLTDFYSIGLTDSTGFVAVDNTNRQIVVAFRGSVSVQNWLSNLNIKMVPYSTVPANKCAGCSVHEGFLDSWLGIRDLVGLALSNARKDYPGYQIVLTGHSLGASIASIAAGDLRTQGFQLSLVSNVQSITNCC